MMLKPLHHAISVPDADASIRWYAETFGFRVLTDEVAAHLNARKVMMELDGFQLELFEYLGEGGAVPVPAERKDPNEDLKICGTKHVAYAVEHLAAMTETLAGKGVPIVKGPVPNGSDLLTFILDNSEILIELIEVGGNK